jgi:tetratricopeptide (TPR) repeat protein
MPDNWLAHNNLGTALADEGKVDEAAEHFRAAVQLNPACDDARNNLGRYLAERGKQDEAKTQIEAVLRRSPRHAGAHRNLGYVLFTEGNIADGVAQYTLARQLRPDDAATPEDLAALLTKQAESPTALPYLRQALDLLPTAEMRAQTASAWAGQGKLQCAIQGYRAALALEPHSPDILNNLAWLLATCPDANIRDGAEAVRLGRQACELTGFRRTLMVGTLAAAYAEAGQFAEAVSTAEKARSLAAESGDEALAGKNQELLQLYRSGHPYHETTNAAPAMPAAPKP